MAKESVGEMGIGVLPNELPNENSREKMMYAHGTLKKCLTNSILGEKKGECRPVR